MIEFVIIRRVLEIIQTKIRGPDVLVRGSKMPVMTRSMASGWVRAKSNVKILPAVFLSLYQAWHWGCSLFVSRRGRLWWK